MDRTVENSVKASTGTVDEICLKSNPGDWIGALLGGWI